MAHAGGRVISARGLCWFRAFPGFARVGLLAARDAGDGSRCVGRSVARRRQRASLLEHSAERLGDMSRKRAAPRAALEAVALVMRHRGRAVTATRPGWPSARSDGGRCHRR